MVYDAAEDAGVMRDEVGMMWVMSIKTVEAEFLPSLNRLLIVDSGLGQGFLIDDTFGW